MIVLAQVNPRWRCSIEYRAMFILNTNTANYQFKCHMGGCGAWTVGRVDVLSLEIYYEEVT